jgi:hypothetical protein
MAGHDLSEYIVSPRFYYEYSPSYRPEEQDKWSLWEDYPVYYRYNYG